MYYYQPIWDASDSYLYLAEEKERNKENKQEKGKNEWDIELKFMEEMRMWMYQNSLMQQQIYKTLHNIDRRLFKLEKRI